MKHTAHSLFQGQLDAVAHWWRQWPLGGACLSHQGDYAALDPPKQRDSTSRTRSPCEARLTIVIALHTAGKSARLTTTLEKCSGSVQWKGNPERKKYDFAQRVNIQMSDH